MKMSGFGGITLPRHMVLTMVLLGERYTWFKLNPETLDLAGPGFKFGDTVHGGGVGQRVSGIGWLTTYFEDEDAVFACGAY